MTFNRTRLRLPVLVACAALFGATLGSPLAGVAASAAHKISGSDIKKGSIAGDRLKKNTVTGKEVKESTLNGLVQGSANQIAFRVAKPKNTGTFTLFKLQDGGTFQGACSSTPLPSFSYHNTTGQTQDFAITLNQQGAPANVSTYGPPMPNAAGLAVTLGALVSNVTAISRTAPIKVAQLTVMTGVDSGACFWSVQGESSLKVTR